MTDGMTFLVTVSGLFWLACYLKSRLFWISLIGFGIMIDWLQHIPMAIEAASNSDTLWLVGINALMGIIVVQLVQLRDIRRAKSWPSMPNGFDNS